MVYFSVRKFENGAPHNPCVVRLSDSTGLLHIGIHELAQEHLHTQGKCVAPKHAAIKIKVN